SGQGRPAQGLAGRLRVLRHALGVGNEARVRAMDRRILEGDRRVHEPALDRVAAVVALEVEALLIDEQVLAGGHAVRRDLRELVGAGLLEEAAPSLAVAAARPAVAARTRVTTFRGRLAGGRG